MTARQLRGCLVALMQIVGRTSQVFHHPKAQTRQCMGPSGGCGQINTPRGGSGPE
jgi:hypothetical protein